MGKSWLRKIGRATHLWGSGSSALSYLSGNVDWRRQRDMANSVYQRAAEDKRKAGINPLFDGASAAPIAMSGTEGGSNDVLERVVGASFGMMGTALSAIKTFAEADRDRASADDIRNFMFSKSGLASAQAAEAYAGADEKTARLKLIGAQVQEAYQNIETSEAQRVQSLRLVKEIDERISLLEQQTRAATSAADRAKVEAEFYTGVGGDIDRWTNAVGFKARDASQFAAQLIGLLKKHGPTEFKNLMK